MRTTLIPLLLLAFGPLHAAAQPVFGVVVEEGRGAPVQGAMVVLFNDGGDRVDRMLTDAAGRFRLQARRAAPHYIVVDRIGYASVTTDRFTPAGGAASMRIEVPVDPIRLRGLVVSAEPRCDVRPEDNQAAARVWEEARKALAAEAWTREAGLYRYTLMRYERDTDREARNVLDERTMAMPDQAAAFTSVPIEDLAEGGFVQAEGDTATVYYAPDAEALLSDAFLDTHCIGVVDGGGTVGLSFQPVAGRTVPEIAGVLWLDAETSELRRIQFGYVNLVESEEVGYPPGEVTFTRLPDGAWVVSQWWIRMPTLIRSRRGAAMRVAQRIEGGVTASITDASGRTVVDAWTTSIFGVVTDTTGTASPAGPVVVALEGAGNAVGITTNADGSFLFTGLDSTRHVVRVPRPELPNMGLAEPEVVVEGRLGEVSHVRLKVPTVTDALLYSCGGTPRPRDTAPVMGRITNADGAPGADVRVRVGWPVATGYAGTPRSAPLGPRGQSGNGWETGREGAFLTAATTTDERGYFLLCDVPYGMRLRLAVNDPADAEPVFRRTWFVPPGSPAVIESINMSSRDDKMTTGDYIESRERWAGGRLEGEP